MSIDHFEEIVKQLNPGFSKGDVKVKRSNGDIETWVLNTFGGIDVSKPYIYIPVITKSYELNKINSLKDFCQLNEID